MPANIDVTQQDAAQVLACIGRYVASINNADDGSFAEGVWSATPDATFIHPRGHEHGWEEIRSNFYGRTMRDTFSQRRLKVSGAPVIRIYGDAAVAEFTWEFTATLRKDGSQRRTAGRESQVYIRTPEAGWRLVQVHYSPEPAQA